MSFYTTDLEQNEGMLTRIVPIDYVTAYWTHQAIECGNKEARKILCRAAVEGINKLADGSR